MIAGACLALATRPRPGIRTLDVERIAAAITGVFEMRD